MQTSTRRRILPAFLSLLALALGAAMLTSPASAAAPVARATAKTYPAVKPLPRNFLWGVATSGFQSEGHSPASNWTRYAKANSKDDPIGTSADFRSRWRGDIKRAKALGVKVYRLSVEWARVEPRPGHWSQSGWRFYDRVIRRIHRAGMRPMITLDHWVYPAWEAKRGGWKHAAMLSDWLRNARKVVKRYVKYHPMWVTINEPTAYFLQELQNGALGPTDLLGFMGNLVKAHDSIYDFIHAHQKHAMVTSNVSYIPGVESVLDATMLDRIAKKLDFVGIDYYYPVSVGNITQLPATLGAFTGTPWTAALSADGLYYALRHYAHQFPHKPLYVVENGMPTDNGKPRADGYTRSANLRDSIYWLQRARDDGMDVIGYNYWSLTDNYEWGSYRPRFGLYTVNVLKDPKLRRHPTDAVKAYRRITANRGVPRHYQPTRKPDFCSLVDFLSSCLDPA